MLEGTITGLLSLKLNIETVGSQFRSSVEVVK